jgi:hypothetical protein
MPGHKSEQAKRAIRASRLDQEAKAAKEDKDRDLTVALEDTFPASDPVSSLRFTRPSRRSD